LGGGEMASLLLACSLRPRPGNLMVSSVGMVTDLQAHEATEALHRAPLSLEECVSIHQALSETSQVLCQKWLKTK
jgi:hypothetical protein